MKGNCEFGENDECEDTGDFDDVIVDSGMPQFSSNNVDVGQKRIFQNELFASYANDRLPRKWNDEEDQRLREAIALHGEAHWRRIANHVRSRDNVQCLQRWQKVIRPGLVKGQWSPEEDAKLVELVNQGFKNWGKLSLEMPGRTSKQCRERWCHHLDPSVVKSDYTLCEDKKLVTLHNILGNHWSTISRLMPGRTENSVRTRLKLLNGGVIPVDETAQDQPSAKVIVELERQIADGTLDFSSTELPARNQSSRKKLKLVHEAPVAKVAMAQNLTSLGKGRKKTGRALTGGGKRKKKGRNSKSRQSTPTPLKGKKGARRTSVNADAQLTVTDPPSNDTIDEPTFSSDSMQSFTAKATELVSTALKASASQSKMVGTPSNGSAPPAASSSSLSIASSQLSTSARTALSGGSAAYSAQADSVSPWSIHAPSNCTLLPESKTSTSSSNSADARCSNFPRPLPAPPSAPVGTSAKLSMAPPVRIRSAPHLGAVKGGSTPVLPPHFNPLTGHGFWGGTGHYVGAEREMPTSLDTPQMQSSHPSTDLIASLSQPSPQRLLESWRQLYNMSQALGDREKAVLAAESIRALSASLLPRPEQATVQARMAMTAGASSINGQSQRPPLCVQSYASTLRTGNLPHETQMQEFSSPKFRAPNFAQVHGTASRSTSSDSRENGLWGISVLQPTQQSPAAVGTTLLPWAHQSGMRTASQPLPSPVQLSGISEDTRRAAEGGRTSCGAELWEVSEGDGIKSRMPWLTGHLLSAGGWASAQPLPKTSNEWSEAFPVKQSYADRSQWRDTGSSSGEGGGGGSRGGGGGGGGGTGVSAAAHYGISQHTQFANTAPARVGTSSTPSKAGEPPMLRYVDGRPSRPTPKAHCVPVQPRDPLMPLCVSARPTVPAPVVSGQYHHPHMYLLIPGVLSSQPSNAGTAAPL